MAGRKQTGIPPGTRFSVGLTRQHADGTFDEVSEVLSESVLGGNGIRLEDDIWFVAFDQAVARFPQSLGMQFIRYLLERPGQRIPVGELVLAEGTGQRVSPATPNPADVARLTREDGLEIASLGDAGEASDETARLAYRKRLKDLAKKREEAVRKGDSATIERIAHEVDRIEAQLRADFDRKGRPRKQAAVSERMRKSVSNRIRAAIRQIRPKHPGFAAHLEESITTGATCLYRPSQDPAWRFDW